MISARRSGLSTNSGAYSFLSAPDDSEITAPAIDNQIGYDGYVFNQETAQYLVRHRSYDTTLGRWLERDP